MDEEELNQEDTDSAIQIQEGVTEKRNPLTLNLKDADFIKTAEELKSGWEAFKKEINLDARRELLKKYRFGREDADTKFKKHEDDFGDSIIYEAESYIGPMAVSKMPDIVVKPGSDTDESKDTAKELSTVLTSDLNDRGDKRVLKLAFEHLPVGLLSAIKPFWDPTKGRYGDYAFRVVHYNNLVFDHKAVTNDARDMDFIGENIELSVKEWVMRFPNKEQDFYKELRKSGHFNDSKNEKTAEGMNSKVKGWEWWFTYYDKKEDGSYERIEAVAWYYNKLVFDKMKSPNWDWEGEPQTFTYDQKKMELKDMTSMMSQAFGAPDEMGQPMGGEPGLLGEFKTEKVYHNHLEYPEKPYIFMGYDQWGESPVDETSRIEQVVKLQKAYNKRARQITEMINRARGKHVFSSEGGLKKSDLEELDLSDPNTDLLVKGKVSEVHSFIPGEQPSVPMVQDKAELRERIFSKMGVHGPARGEVDMGSPATNNQLSREGDFTRSDDLTDDTINYVAEKMSNWKLQFIKLRYTQDHFKKTLGPDGETVWSKLNRDMVEDGMEVSISASGSDKLKAEQKAMDMAKLQMTDPFTFFTDIGASDPKGRTKRLIMFMDPNMRSMYLQDLGIDIAGAMTGALGAQQPGGAPAPAGQDGAAQAAMDIAMIQQGQLPQVPQVVDGGYLQAFTAFAMTPEFEQLTQQIPGLLDFAEQINQLGQQQATQPPAQPPVVPQGAPDGTGGGVMPGAANAGPLGGNPSPQNTSKIAALPNGAM